MNPRELSSRFYTGTLRHRRFSPVRHEFSFKLFMCWINLDELEHLPFIRDDRRWRWVRFQREDYLAPYTQPLKVAVLDEVEKQTRQRPQGAVYLLTHLRYGGICFNPISLYYCFNPEGELQALLGEVSNLPWQERHVYVASCEPHQRKHSARFTKQMHVSPFNPMQQEYRWRFTTPDQQLVMHMDNLDAQGSIPFDSTLVLDRQDDLGVCLSRLLWRHPWMTLKVVVGIHFEALRLWLKRIPVYPHPKKKVSKG